MLNMYPYTPWAFYSPDCTIPAFSASLQKRDALVPLSSLWSCPRLFSICPRLSCSGEPRKGANNAGVSDNMLHNADQNLSQTAPFKDSWDWSCSDIRHLPQHSWMQSTKDLCKSALFKCSLMWRPSSTKVSLPGCRLSLWFWGSGVSRDWP